MRSLALLLIRSRHLQALCIAASMLLIGSSSAVAVYTVWNGPNNGNFRADANWSLGAPAAADSAFFNNNFTGNVTFSESVETLDLFLNNTTGEITFDVDPSGLGNSYRMSRFTVLGSAAGETNHVVATSGVLESGKLLIGNAAGSINNRVEVTGAGTYWKATGSDGTGVGAAINVGSFGGSNSSLVVSNGGRMESFWFTIVGLQGASNNELVVTGAGSQYANKHSLSLGDNIAPEIPGQTNNQLKVLDGGFVTTRELIIGTTEKSPDNTVRVSGAGSRLNVRGAVQTSGTAVGQKNDVGRASTNNRLIVENGGVVDGGAIFLLGRYATSTGNLLSVSSAGALSSAGIENNQGTVLIDHGSVDISRMFDNVATFTWRGGSFLAQTASSVVDFRSGSLGTVNATVSNGSVMTIGDGGPTAAVYRMKKSELGVGGTHSFANGLFLNTNGRLEGVGTIVGNVSGAAGAAASIGLSPGVINVTGNWNNTGLGIALELDNLATSIVPGVQFDQLNITGLFTHGGTVTIDRSQLMAPATAKQLKLIGWGSQAGLSTSTAVSFQGGGPLTYNFLSDGLYVTVPASSGIAGDYNNNGIVDAADYVVWRENEGTNNTLFNNSLPGPIGQPHYNQWRANFGKPPGSGASLAESANVPEPATTILVIVVIACGAIQRHGTIRAGIYRSTNTH